MSIRLNPIMLALGSLAVVGGCLYAMMIGIGTRPGRDGPESSR